MKRSAGFGARPARKLRYRGSRKTAEPRLRLARGKMERNSRFGRIDDDRFHVVNGNEIKGTAWLHGLRKPSGATATRELPSGAK
jgi:hypothetical protein